MNDHSPSPGTSQPEGGSMTSAPDHAHLKAVTADDSAERSISEEARLLEALGFRRKALGVAQAIADQRGTTMAEELIRLDFLRADVWWTHIARELGLPYLTDLQLAERSPDALLSDARLFQRVRQVWLRTPATTTLVVAPLGLEIDRLSRDITLDPSMRGRIAIAAPQTIRLAFQRSFESTLTSRAVNRLQVERPAMSASNGPALARRIIVLIAVALALAFFFPRLMLTALDFLFLTAGWLRLAAAVDKEKIVEPPPLTDAELPTYTVLVPLFREAHVICDLVRALEQIDYPPDRLSMSLVVEADDDETVMAARRITAGSRIRVIAVAPSKPRTKPKALSWALPLTSGELLTVYDAEDRPARDQLRRAAAAFAAAPPGVVCIQAMLDIDHAAASSNWLARQFALEYRVLFRALLPWLAAKRLFLPLGGTSNHFRGIR